MRVSFVVPRYGPTIIGGAETAARALAEHLVERKGWEVEVLTGCAEDFVTWAEVFPPGEEVINGVRVVRFASQAGRDPSFHPFSASLLADPGRASLADAERWIDLQGPVLPDLVDAALDSDADALIFYPYLYYPTVRLIDRARVPTILHPAAHDEPALRLPVFGPVFGAADGLVFQTAAERDLVQGRFPVASHRQLLLGLGVDDPGDGPDAGRRRRTGRASRRPGVHAEPAPVIPIWCAWAGSTGTRAPGCWSSCSRPTSSAIPVPSGWSWPDRWSMRPRNIRTSTWWVRCRNGRSGRSSSGATALVSPSPWEAFSLVVAESWSAGTPVVVNAGCAATVEHCRRSGAGLSFAGFGEFEAVVDRLYRDEATPGPARGPGPGLRRPLVPMAPGHRPVRRLRRIRGRNGVVRFRSRAAADHLWPPPGRRGWRCPGGRARPGSRRSAGRWPPGGR